MKKVVWWTIEVEWEDGKRECISSIPNHVANEVDNFLTELEEERTKEEPNDK
jgi:hypothetical protein